MRIVIFLLVAAILAGLAALYGLFGSNQTNQAVLTNTEGTAESSEVTKEPEVEILTGEASLVNLKTLGKNLECRISYVAPDMINPIIGTYFIYGEKIRGDFEITSPEYPDPFVSSTIYNQDKYYSWSKIGDESYGIKLETSAMDEVDSETLREPVPSSGTVSYECRAGNSVDGSIFEPPSDVLFRDLGEIMQSGMEFGTIYEETI